ncbi:MAG: hypothetical protein J6Y22_10250 [Paludibacteraceae bacterium]|nr:hypothetical protein [Paludibacteraceae bacterium]
MNTKPTLNDFSTKKVNNLEIKDEQESDANVSFDVFNPFDFGDHIGYHSTKRRQDTQTQ